VVSEVWMDPKDPRRKGRESDGRRGRLTKVDDKLLCLFEGSESLYEWRCVMIVAMKTDCQR
jgi:hypothetical protein